MSPHISRTLSALLCLASTAAAQTKGVTVRAIPSPAYIERVGTTQYFALDFQVSNKLAGPVDLSRIVLKAFDRHGGLLLWDKVDGNGTRPANEVLGRRRIDPGESLTVFDPFAELDTAVPIVTLQFEFAFDGPEGVRLRDTVEVRPREFTQKTRLILPIRTGHVWTYDGGGFLSHHRRIDLQDPQNRDLLGIHANGQRYALDLVAVDDSGKPYHGDPALKENWVGFGIPVIAPAAGTVVAVVNGQPEEMEYDEARMTRDPKSAAPNFIIIDHGNGEFSMMAHFRTGSITVKPGERVRQGQIIGRMGRSGMGSQLVHVHYELQSGPSETDSEGLPARFESFRRAGAAQVTSGRIGPGWIVDPVPPRS